MARPEKCGAVFGKDARNNIFQGDIMGYFPSWRLTSNAVVLPDERLPASAAIPMGVQHLLAMSGSTIVAPLLMGFDPNVAVFFSGIGTLLFFVLTAGRVPSYLGSSFAFIAVVIAATGYGGSGPNPNIAIALGGIIACGALYALIGLVVMAIGTGWVERLMPRSSPAPSAFPSASTSRLWLSAS